MFPHSILFRRHLRGLAKALPALLCVYTMRNSHDSHQPLAIIPRIGRETPVLQEHIPPKTSEGHEHPTATYISLRIQ